MNPTCQSNNTILLCWHDFFLTVELPITWGQRALYYMDKQVMHMSPSCNWHSLAQKKGTTQTFLPPFPFLAASLKPRPPSVGVWLSYFHDQFSPSCTPPEQNATKSGWEALNLNEAVQVVSSWKLLNMNVIHYTLLQKKCTLINPSSAGDPGSLTLT